MNLQRLIFFITIVFFFLGTALTQTTDSSRAEHERRGVGGAEVARSWRSDGFSGYFFRFFYEAEIEKTFLNAGFLRIKN